MGLLSAAEVTTDKPHRHGRSRRFSCCITAASVVRGIERIIRCGVATVSHDDVVVKHRGPLEVIQIDGPKQLAFLTTAGLTGPHLTAHGIAYRNDDIEIAVSYFGPREPEVSTAVHWVQRDGTRRRADLGCLHVACGHGVLQDVPGNAPNPKATAKRISQHAAVLRRALPRLLDADAILILRRCPAGQQLPLQQ